MSAFAKLVICTIPFLELIYDAAIFVNKLHSNGQPSSSETAAHLFIHYKVDAFSVLPAQVAQETSVGNQNKDLEFPDYKWIFLFEI